LRRYVYDAAIDIYFLDAAARLMFDLFRHAAPLRRRLRLPHPSPIVILTMPNRTTILPPSRLRHRRLPFHSHAITPDARCRREAMLRSAMARRACY